MKLYTGNLQDIPLEGDQQPTSEAILESRLQTLRVREQALQGDPLDRGRTLLEIGRILLRMERKDEAWESAKTAFDLCLAQRAWEPAVEACEILFESDRPLSLAALGQGIWLGVTFPINPDITVEMLRRVVEETPDDSDGAAVAAATANYVADLRAENDRQHQNLTFYTGQMLSYVARRHGKVQDQADFELWLKRLELDDPDKFLIRLRNVVDVLVQDDWWFDREQLLAGEAGADGA